MKPKNTTDWKEKKINQNQAYLQLSYGFVKKWEAYLRVGGADLKVKNFLIGGFAGVRLPLTKGLNLEVEGQLKSKFSMGGALTYSF